MEIVQIDVQKILQEKNPKLANIRFIVSWLKKLIHQDEMNEFLRKNKDLQDLEFIEEVLKFFNVKVEIIYTHPDLIKSEKCYIFAANHPLGGLDGMIFIQAISHKFKEIKFPVNDILLHLKNLESFFLGIETIKKKQSHASVKKINEAYTSNQQILIFPSGKVSRKKHGEIRDLVWKDHFIKKAIETNRDVVPVYIEGQNSKWFYRIANWCEYLGLSKIAMLYLPDEMFKQNNKTITIIIGKPISYEIFTKKLSQSWANKIKKKVYELAH